MAGGRPAGPGALARSGGGELGTGERTLTLALLPEGFRIGHWTDERRRTGCTVILAAPDCVGAVDVRGGAPGTRETQAFVPGNLVSEIHAVVLTGGSAFGLASAGGVTRYLKDQGVGFAIGGSRVPIVPAGVLFDLGVGDPDAFPDEAAGYAAAREARGQEIAEGAVGAGAGATVGKILGPAGDARVDHHGRAGHLRPDEAGVTDPPSRLLHRW